MAGSGDELQLLDGYHKHRFGWARAIPVTMGDASGQATLQTSEARGSFTLERGKRPLVFYDPARYDTVGRSGEFFLVEYRNGASWESYDEALSTPGNQSPKGLSLWQVATDEAGGVYTIPAEGGAEGIDASVNHLGAPVASGAAYVRGNWELWTKANGWIRPRYIDGTPANLELRVVSDTTREWIDIEWRRPATP